MMISSVSAKNMSNKPNCGKQPACSCCKHGDCKHAKCQPKPVPAFGGDRGNKPLTLPAPCGQRPVEVGRPQNTPNSPSFGKRTTKSSGVHNTNSSNRSFGNMKR